MKRKIRVNHNQSLSLWSSPLRYLNLSALLKSVLLLSFLFQSLFITAQTISPKRGVSGDLLNNADCITADTLTWYYNWANTPNAAVINTHQNYLEFCPMLWNGSWNPTALTNYLNAHPEVDYLLAFNEPNYNVQANMTPAQAAALWPQVEAIANTYNLKIVGPAMSYCSGTCIPGYDNMHGTVWMDDFLAACPGCRVDYIGLHIYDTWYHGFRGVADMYKKYNRPIWITEFDYSGATTPTQHASLMVDVIDWMEKDPAIFRYAWFLVRSSPGAGSTDIYSQTTGVLASLGDIYMHMSSYDELYYHTVNKIIEAEHYISKSVIYCGWNGSTCTWPYSILLEPTTDVTGKLDAYHFASPTAYTNDTLYYNIDIPTTQAYTIDFRVNSTAASTIQVRTSPGNVLLGTTSSLNTGGAWNTINLSGVNLTAGQQKIYFTASNGTPLKLNWFRINCSVNCGSLPVELNYFNILSQSSHSVQVEWETANEINNKEFEVERSDDGITFESIATIPAQLGTGVKSYSYTDTEAYASLLYYRLKQVDLDGTVTYSAIKTLLRENSSLTINQNIIISELTSPQEIYYTVLNVRGQVVGKGSYMAESGVMEKEIQLPQLSGGIYFIKVTTNTQSYTGKILSGE